MKNKQGQRKEAVNNLESRSTFQQRIYGTHKYFSKDVTISH